jgi:predicted nucleic acid-binding Zn ribbon protein
MIRRERRKGGDPEKLGDLIKPVLKELKIVGRRVGKALHEAWIDVAGPALSGRTRLHSFKAGILVVEVDSSPLLHELQNFQGAELLAKLRVRVGKPHISALRFRLGAFGSHGG